MLGVPSLIISETIFGNREHGEILRLLYKGVGWFVFILYICSEIIEGFGFRVEESNLCERYTLGLLYFCG